MDFDLVFDHGAVIDAKGWTAEVRIPLTSINDLEKHGRGSWFFSLTRFIPREFSEGDSILPIHRGSNSRDLDRDLDWVPLSSERQTIAFAKITWLFD